jgi:hypothetical protein
MNGKYKIEIDDCSNELNKIKTWIDSNKLDSNIKYLVSYAVIKSCGTIENVFKQIIFDHVSKGSNEEAMEFLTKNIINSSCNPKTGQIQKMLDQINSKWSNEFATKIIAKNQKGQLNSLVELRNNFSHGNDITSSIENVIVLFQAGVWILEKLHECIYIE